MKCIRDSNENKHPPFFSVSQARSQLYRLIDEAAQSHEPITITGKRANAVLLAEGRLESD